MSTIAESPGATVAVLWAQQVSGAGTVGVIRNETCFRKFFSPGCINLKNLFAHNQEEFLRIPKHPKQVEQSYSNFKKVKDYKTPYDIQVC